MIDRCSPGGVTSNILTKFAMEMLHLSISLTAVTQFNFYYFSSFIIFTSADLFEITNISQKISMTWYIIKNVFGCNCSCNLRDDYKKIFCEF